MITREKQIILMHDIAGELKSAGSVSSAELYEQMFPGVVQFGDFDQCFQHVRSGHDLPPIPSPEPEKQSEPESENKTPETGKQDAANKPETNAKEAEESASPQFVSRQSDAAEILGVSEDTFREWRDTPGFPDKVDRQYDIAAIRDWLEQPNESGDDGDNGDAPADETETEPDADADDSETEPADESPEEPEKAD